MNKPSEKTVFFICASTAAVMFVAAILACISFFIKADRNQTEARLLNQAVVESTSIAETLKASDGDLTKAGQFMKNHMASDVTDTTLTFYYGENLRPTPKSSSSYKAVITRTDLEHCFQYDIVFLNTETNTSFYELSFKAVRSGGM